MIKSLNIELALCNNKLCHNETYKIVQLHYNFNDIEYEISNNFVNKNYIPNFIQNKKINKTNKQLLEYVSYFIAKYLLENNIDYTKYNFSESYAYFCFYDENDKLVFSTPHITSPILFNPNDKYSNYVLISNVDSFLLSKAATNLHKKTSIHILNYEHTLSRQFNKKNKDKKTFNNYIITYKEMVSSLLDYYINKAMVSSQTIELKSIYEDSKLTSELPEILTISSYELKTFTYNSEKTYY